MPALSVATLTGVTPGAAAAGTPVNGCVFFIRADAGAEAGLGDTVTRAVSLLGVMVGRVGAAFGASALDFPAGGTGGGTKRGVCAGLFGGGGGINGLAIAGRGALVAGGFVGGELAGEGVGKAIPPVSGGSGGSAPGGVRGIRTVSFFGSVGSAIRTREFIYYEIVRKSQTCHSLTYGSRGNSCGSRRNHAIKSNRGCRLSSDGRIRPPVRAHSR